MSTFHLPLFHPRLVRERIASVPPARFDECLPILAPWLEQLHSGQLGEATEISLHGGFLENVFGRVLGYTTRAYAAAGHYNLAAEVPVPGGSADAAIGFFRSDSRHILAPIELKGASQPLEQSRGRKMTPVQQAWDYGNKIPESRFIIVSNYRETRLYSKSMGPAHYELFLLDDLASLDGFLRFYALLCRDSFLPLEPSRPSLAEEMLVQSQQADRDVTARLYKEYRQLRVDFFAHLQNRHPNIPAVELLTCTQTVLDRMLFLAFAEDRGLIPPRTIASAIDHVDYSDRPIWQNLLALFRFIDKGSEARNIPAYNGGLFSHVSALDELDPLDESCRWFKQLAAYDFKDDVSVEVLGHVFEQSISDLEELRAEAVARSNSAPIEEPAVPRRQVSKRKSDGIFYTPSFVTAFLVRETLQVAFAEALERAEDAARVRAEAHRAKDRRNQLPPPRDRQIWKWEAYQQQLRALRVLDPACGSGAFLVAAFDALAAEFDRANRNLSDLKGRQQGLFDLNKTVLNENLFGVDLNGESVEITRLSLWLKTAQRNRTLAFLDRNVQRGNSVVSDPLLDYLAFDWSVGSTARDMSFLIDPTHRELASQIDARWKEGFDVVLGNPPYVRQELLKPYKAHWQSTFKTYNSSADLFVYFFERSLSLLKPGGRLGYIVSNKWLKTGYAEALRSELASRFTIERLVDFGHAPIFEDADAFPCIIIIRNTEPAPEHAIEVTQYPREELGKEVLQSYIESHSFPVRQSTLSAAGWSLEPPAVASLMARVSGSGSPLSQYLGARPLYGIKTGFNEAFFVDQSTRDRLIAEDSSARDIFKRYLRGKDIDRWLPQWAGQWVILLKSSDNSISSPWANCTDEAQAELVFKASMPSIYSHMKQHEDRLRAREDQGRFWWELRSCAYYDAFDERCIAYTDITWTSSFCFSQDFVMNNTTYILPSSSSWVLACLSSPLIWAYMWRSAQHGKDDALRMFSDFVSSIPIPEPTSEVSSRVEGLVEEILTAKAAISYEVSAVESAILLELGVPRLPDEYHAPSKLISLSYDDFLAWIRKRKGKDVQFTPAILKYLDSIWRDSIEPTLLRATRLLDLEKLVAAEVHRAYRLTPADEDLLWYTAPPRMPGVTPPQPSRTARTPDGFDRKGSSAKRLPSSKRST